MKDIGELMLDLCKTMVDSCDDRLKALVVSPIPNSGIKNVYISGPPVLMDAMIDVVNNKIGGIEKLRKDKRYVLLSKLYALYTHEMAITIFYIGYPTAKQDWMIKRVVLDGSVDANEEFKSYIFDISKHLLNIAQN